MSLGCPLDISSSEGYTPLALATRERHVQVVKVLLDAGCDPMAVSPLGTPKQIGNVHYPSETRLCSYF